MLFTDFASSSLNFELRFWIADIAHGVDISTDLRVAIDRVFAEHGVEMPFPQMDIHLHEESAARLVPPDQKGRAGDAGGVSVLEAHGSETGPAGGNEADRAGKGVQ